MNHNLLTFATVTAIATASGYLVWSYFTRQKKKVIPTEWTKVGIIAKCYMYPIKSCKYILLDEAECTILGLKKGILRDRTMMVIDEKQNFITGRAYPEMLQINISSNDKEIIITHANMEELRIDNSLVRKGKVVYATVWGCKVQVYDCGDEASEWFSRVLLRSSSGLRLVLYASENPRPEIRSKNIIFEYYRKSDTGAMPDETPYNMINLSSVDDLNSRIKNGESIKPICFRPNFMIKDAKPFDEDNWKFVKIGDNIFEIIKACQRCVFTTIDPEVGIRHEHGEPIKTLKTYRQYQDEKMLKSLGTAPRMGVQMALRSEPHIIRVNDPIYAAY